MTSLVSIIIPVYNRAHLIPETLSSVLNQTYSNWECIIVDDGSSDDIETAIHQFISKETRFRFYSRPSNKRKGANSCRNFGVENSKGDFFLFLDSDDLLKRECLEKRLEAFNNFPDLDFAIFSMGLFKNSQFENYYYQDLSQKNRNELLGLFLTGPLPWNMTRPFWRKTFFLEQGGFNENLDLFDDDEFNIKIVYNSNIRFKIFDNIDCYYRIYKENTSKYKDRKFIEKLFRSHLVFLKTLNKLFNSEDKILLKKELMQNIVRITGYIHQENIYKSLFIYNIMFYTAKFKSPFSFKFFLLLKFLVAYYPAKVRGSYKVNQILNYKIKQVIDKC